jgi:hypothetical protein
MGEYSESESGQDDSGMTEDSSQQQQDPSQVQIALDPSDFPALMLYAQFDNTDDLLQYLGVDVSTITDDEPPAVA